MLSLFRCILETSIMHFHRTYTSSIGLNELQKTYWNNMKWHMREASNVVAVHLYDGVYQKAKWWSIMTSRMWPFDFFFFFFFFFTYLFPFFHFFFCLFFFFSFSFFSALYFFYYLLIFFFLQRDSAWWTGGIGDRRNNVKRVICRIDWRYQWVKSRQLSTMSFPMAMK